MIVVPKARIMFLNCLLCNIWKLNIISDPASGSETMNLKLYHKHNNAKNFFTWIFYSVLEKHFCAYKENVSELKF